MDGILIAGPGSRMHGDFPPRLQCLVKFAEAEREIPLLLTRRVNLQCGTSVFGETLERKDSLWASTHSFTTAE